MTPQNGPSDGAGVPGSPGAPGAPGAPRPETTVDPRVEPTGDDIIEAVVEPMAEAPNPTVVDDLDDLLFAARRERDEYLDLSRRVQADFENYKKRMLRQQTDNLERAAEDLVTKVLPVLDAFDLARAHLGDGEDVSAEGKALVAGSTLLADTLAREGLERIGVPGEAFDPTTHEAVDHVSADVVAPAPPADEDRVAGSADGPSGPVVDEVLRAGYRWKGRVIRPAMVRVRGVMVAQREWLDKDYYQVLGVSPTATDKEITRAYRKLAKQFHPDANPGSEDRFKDISAAHDVIGDPAKRKEYDEVRRLGPAGFGGFGGPGAHSGPGGATFRVEDLGDLGDLFGGLGGTFGGGRRARNAGPRRGADVEAELYLSFEDAVRGVTTSVNVVGEARCETCNGSGAAPGTSPVTCPTCHGRGALDDNQGLFSLSRVCPQCSGRGTVVETPCPTCRGSGIVRRTRQVKVRIPAGVEDGQRIRVKGRGAPGRAHGPAGDLFVTVRVGKHPLFGRRGRNLTLTAPVTFPEAALGSTVKVPTLDEPVTLRVPAGTSSGKTFRVKGRGVPGHGRTSAGDLLVTVDVTVPKKLTDEQRAAVEEFARVSNDEPRAHLEVNTDDATAS